MGDLAGLTTETCNECGRPSRTAPSRSSGSRRPLTAVAAFDALGGHAKTATVMILAELGGGRGTGEAGGGRRVRAERYRRVRGGFLSASRAQCPGSDDLGERPALLCTLDPREPA